MHKWRLLITALVIIIACGVAGIITYSRPRTGQTQHKLRSYAEALHEAAQLAHDGKTNEALSRYETIAAIEDIDAVTAARSYLEAGKLYEAQGKLFEAKKAYQQIIMSYPNVAFMPEVEDLLGEVNIAILFSPAMTDNDIMYMVNTGDTLSGIAKAHGTTVDIIRQANGLKGDLIRAGKEIKIPQVQFSIVVDKSLNQLFLQKNGELIKKYIVSTGYGNSSPVGTFEVINKLLDPVWYTAGAIVPPESPDNILGTRWLGLSKAGYGIHGTTEPDTLGQQVTQGCVRMRNKDVEELYALIPIGTKVTIID